jgi:hypothetical protein
MKAIVLGVSLLALAACSDMETQKKMLACTGTTIQQAAHGDFSGWVLPSFVGGRPMRPGQWLNADCEISGKPHGPQF